MKPGWRKVKFGEVVRLSKARCQDPLAEGFDRYVGLEHLEPGDLRVRSWGNVADGVTFTNVFKSGQVLFGKRRAYQRKVAVADFPGVCSGDIYVLESQDDDTLLPELLPFICQTDAFFEHAVGTSAGSLSPRTNWTSLVDFEFSLPPMEEQRSLIDLMTSVDESAAAVRSAFNVAQTLLRSTLVSIIVTPGTSTAVTEIGEDILLPGWRLLPASEICVAPITKGAPPSSAIGAHDTGIPFLKVYNLTFDSALDSTIDPMFISHDVHSNELARSQVFPGDVLMDIVRPPLGKVSIVPRQFPTANINQAIARFRPPTAKAGELLSAYLLSGWAQRWLTARSKKTSGQQNLTLELCQTLPVPVPPPEQEDIVLTAINTAFEVVRQFERRQELVMQLYRTLLHEVVSNV